MSGRTSRKYYFDACVYLAYLRNEVSHYGKNAIDAIHEMWEDCKSDRCVIVTSVLTLTEVPAYKLTAQEAKLFAQVTEGGLHEVIDIGPPVCLRARHYRDHYHANPVKNGKGDHKKHLTPPDAIHLATAVIYKCDEFLTFDGCRSTKADASIGLLWLKNKAGDDEIIIAQPRQVQGTLGI